MVRERRGNGADSVAERVRRYIDARPVVRDALAMDIVNLSALTRRILDETGMTSQEAVLAACRRYEVKRHGRGYQEEIRRVLSKSKLEVRTHVCVVTAPPSWRSFAKIEEALKRVRGRDVPLHVLQGSESLTVITDEGMHDEIVELLGEEMVLKSRRGLVEVNLRSPEVIEDVPGILAFLTSTLADQGVNFIDVISCYKDNMFILEEEHLFPAFGTLNRLISG